MAIANAYMEVTSGFEARCTIGSTLFVGPSKPAREYTQPNWYDNASVSNRVSKLGFKTGTLAAGATVTIDLTALDSPDGGSGTVSLSALVVGCIQITGTTGKLRIGNAAANPHALSFGAGTHTWTVFSGADGSQGPGLLFGDPSGVGWVVDGTAKNVKLENTHGSQSVDYIAFFGGT